MTLHALIDSRRAGYTLSTLGSSELGRNVYRSLGFTEYGTIYHYLSPA